MKWPHGLMNTNVNKICKIVLTVSYKIEPRYPFLSSDTILDIQKIPSEPTASSYKTIYSHPSLSSCLCSRSSRSFSINKSRQEAVNHFTAGEDSVFSGGTVKRRTDNRNRNVPFSICLQVFAIRHVTVCNTQCRQWTTETGFPYIIFYDHRFQTVLNAWILPCLAWAGNDGNHNQSLHERSKNIICDICLFCHCAVSLHD